MAVRLSLALTAPELTYILTAVIHRISRSDPHPLFQPARGAGEGAGHPAPAAPGPSRAVRWSLGGGAGPPPGALRRSRAGATSGHLGQCRDVVGARRVRAPMRAGPSGAGPDRAWAHRGRAARGAVFDGGDGSRGAGTLCSLRAGRRTRGGSSEPAARRAGPGAGGPARRLAPDQTRANRSLAGSPGNA